MENSHQPASPATGKSSTWTSAAKSGVGRAINGLANVIFTINNGYVTEVYYPREDIACIKDIRFGISDGQTFFSDEATDAESDIAWMGKGIPAFHIINRCVQNKILLVAAMFVCLVFFLLLISIGAAVFINHYFKNDFAGFLIVGACYPVICLLLFACRKKLFMGIVNKQILRQLLKANHDTVDVLS